MLFNNQFNDKIATGPGVENCSFALFAEPARLRGLRQWPNLDLFGQSIKSTGGDARSEAVDAFPFPAALQRAEQLHVHASEQQSGSRPARRW